MFEKEAEETVKRCVCGDCNNCQSHGYIGCDTYRYSRDSYLRGAEFGYNKANEWHYVKDEGLPKNNNDGTTYLLYTIYGLGGSPVVAHFAYRDKQELMNVWTGAILTEDKIIAWKEIVLPELKETK